MRLRTVREVKGGDSGQGLLLEPFEATACVMNVKEHDDSIESPEHFLRRARYWVLLPFGTYLIAIPGLGPGAYFVPVVVYLAPLGVISYFDDVSLDFERSGHQTALLGIHAVFWFFFVLGLTKRERFSLRVLTTIWVGLVVLLFMSVTGCTMKFGEGLRSPGNWH